MNIQLQPNTELELIQSCIKGNRLAQKELYGKYMPAMYNRAIRMLGNQEDAKDAIQEVFAVVFRDLESYRGEASLGSWIKVITINRCLNHIKVRKKHFAEMLEEERIGAETETAEPFDVKKIHRAITQLPTGSRTVFNLYMIEGYQHKEIAEILEISESTSKTQYRRAKAMIRDLLKKEKG